jgi:hypothetical protein
MPSPFSQRGKKAKKSTRDSDWFAMSDFDKSRIYKAQAKRDGLEGGVVFCPKSAFVSFRSFEPHRVARAPRLAVLAVGLAFQIPRAYFRVQGALYGAL